MFTSKPKLRTSGRSLMVRYHQFAVSVHDTHSTSVLQLFETESEETVGKLIRRSPSKSCDLDPIPTSLLKTFLSSVLPAITNIVNSSIETGIVPQQLKKAREENATPRGTPRGMEMVRWTGEAWLGHGASIRPPLAPPQDAHSFHLEHNTE